MDWVKKGHGNEMVWRVEAERRGNGRRKERVGGLDRRKGKGNGGKEMARGEAEWRQYEK